MRGLTDIKPTDVASLNNKRPAFHLGYLIQKVSNEFEFDLVDFDLQKVSNEFDLVGFDLPKLISEKRFTRTKPAAQAQETTIANNSAYPIRDVKNK